MPITLSSSRRQVFKGMISPRPANALVADLACEVHNASSAGATLRVKRAENVPSAFLLTFADGATQACAVMRRSRIDLAVRFR